MDRVLRRRELPVLDLQQEDVERRRKQAAQEGTEPVCKVQRAPAERRTDPLCVGKATDDRWTERSRRAACIRVRTRAAPNFMPAPVYNTAQRCDAKSVRPIATGAWGVAALFSAARRKTTKTSAAVMNISIKTACARLVSAPGAGVTTRAPGVRASSTPAAAMPATISAMKYMMNLIGLRMPTSARAGQIIHGLDRGRTQRNGRIEGRA